MGITAIFVAMITIGVPLYGMVTKNHTLLMWWLCATLGLDILAVRMAGIFPATEVFGLLYFPSVLVLLGWVLSNRTGKLLLAYFGLIASLGILFGFLIPWPDFSGERPWIQQSSGRSISYIVAVISHLSVVVYVAVQVRRGFPLTKILMYLVHGTSILSFGVLFEAVTGVDLLNTIVPAVPLEEVGRLRGFAAEPKYAGQLISIGLLILLYSRTGVRRRIWLVCFHLIAVLLTVSAASMAVLVTGLIVGQLFSKAARERIVPITVAAVASVGLIRTFLPSYWESWIGNITYRWFRDDPVSLEPSNPVERVVSSMQVFDASALLFLWHNPFHFLIGTGPGLVSIPASAYIPTHALSVSFGGRIDNPPYMGIILLLSNGGIVLLLVAMAIVIACIRDMKVMATISQNPESIAWYDFSRLLVIVSVLFLVQNNVIVYVFIGVGLAAGLELTGKEDWRLPNSRSIPSHSHFA